MDNSTFQLIMEHIDPVLRFFWQGEWRGAHREPWRRIYDCEMVYTRYGEHSVTIKDQTWHLRKGSVIVIPPAQWHTSWTEPDRTTYRVCIHFDWLPDHQHISTPMAAIRDRDFDPGLIHPVPPVFARYLPLIVHDLPDTTTELLDLLAHRIAAGQASARYSLWPVLRILLDYVRDQELPSQPLLHTGRSARAVLNLKQYLERHYTEELNYEDFTRLTGLAKSTVCNVFKELVGTSPLSYLNDIRLNQACHLLRSSQLTVAEIARTVGIRDANYFSRLFRKNLGISPSRYTRQSAEQDKM